MSAPTRLTVLFAACLCLALGRAVPSFAQSPPAARGTAQDPAWTSDPSDTRLVLMPTARTLPHGASSLTFVDFFLPLVQFGVTDRLSIGAGTIAPIPVPSHPVVLLAKLQLYDDNRTRAAAGVVHATNLGEASLGFAYGVVTRGTDDDSWTAGAGWMYARAEGEGGSVPVAFFGGEHRLSAHQKVIGDVLIHHDSAVANVGLRVMRHKFAADFAALVMMNSAGPFSGATISLGWRF